MITIRTIPLIMITSLAGCMSGDRDGEATDPVAQLSFAELNALETSLIDDILDAGVTTTVPDAGTASYDGTMTLLLQDGSMDGVIGTAEVTVDFVSNNVGGGAGDFYDLNGDATAGEVSIENAVVVDVLGNFIAGEVNGTVTFAAGEMDVATGLAGNFSGDQAEYVSGVMSGTATPDGGSAIAVQGAVYAVD